MNDLIGRIGRYVANRGVLDTTFFLLTMLIQLLRGLMRGYWLVFIGKGVLS